MKKHEIWLGYYHLGQGYDPPTKPELVATVEARTFEIACFRYELENSLKWLLKAEKENSYIDIHSRSWQYRPHDNSNSWTGKYYPSREEALKSFK